MAMASAAQAQSSPDRPDIAGDARAPQNPAHLTETVRKNAAAAASVQQYCSNIENLSQSLPSRIFAEVPSSAGQPSHWAEFSTETEWESAGAPEPKARAWYSDGKVVLVRMTSHKSGETSSEYAYCYASNGAIARIAAVPTQQIQCDDANYRCLFISAFERLYLPDGQKVEVINDFDSRLLKSEKTVFATSRESPPEYPAVSDLPFAGLLR
jgi:hypothetical protein